MKKTKKMEIFVYKILVFLKTNLLFLDIIENISIYFL